MRTLFVMLVSLTCSVSLAEKPKRPKAVEISQKQIEKERAKAEARERWLNEVRDRYWNRQWFEDALDEYAKTGVKPKVKLPPGIRVEFAEHPDERVLGRHLATVSGFYGFGSERRQGRRGLVGGSVWIDEKVVSWKEVEAGKPGR